MKREIDLKLLKIIHTVVTTGSVTEAARKLKQSAGNISYQLGKARELTGVYLFIRTRNGMKPDSTALELSQRYQQFIDSNIAVQDLSSYPQQKSLSINTFSLLEMMLANNVCNSKNSDTLFRYIFNSYVSNPEERLLRLRKKDVHIDIGNKLPADEAITTVKLFTSNVHVLVGSQNLPVDGSLSMQELRSSRYVIWSAIPDYYSDSMEGAVRTSQFIQSQDVAVVSGSMINMVSLCANSRYIMLIPNIFAPMLERNFQVKCMPLPPELDIRYDCYLHYSAQLDREPWLLKSIHGAIASMNFDNPQLLDSSILG
ncbi:LysR family transcriptional regulator [Enterobacteriaceae bacterium H11S18]|uniref:LysR family transcriptional regulator n=1 Tax=Dryocola clanedunensis TaxID=2925396 RepID=UPI0022F077FB|nr:LysR family transcriptional regulator [Dryocola clanedunensis]MCT4707719.1 LysR family transcriptional regulator [Dryocola clanedunensis]MCT4711105.1 LysR family transcriptional regulator [Dryocola clanedunensis]